VGHERVGSERQGLRCVDLGLHLSLLWFLEVGLDHLRAFDLGLRVDLGCLVGGGCLLDRLEAAIARDADAAGLELLLGVLLRLVFIVDFIFFIHSV